LAKDKEPTNAELRARTILKLDGDAEIIVPISIQRRGQGFVGDPPQDG